MLLTKLKALATVMLIVVLTGVGLATLTGRANEQREIAGEARKGSSSYQAPATQLPSDSKKNDGRSSQLVKIPSPLDGIVQFIGTEIKEGEKVPPEYVITVQTDGEMKTYRRLAKGDVVEEGQLLVRMDNRMALADLAFKKLRVIQSRADSNGAKAIAEEADLKLETQELVTKKGAGTEVDLRDAKLTRDKMNFDSISKKEAANLAEAELRQVQTLIELHDIRGKVSGVIANIKKKPGNTARKLDTVLEIDIKAKDRHPQTKTDVDKSKSLVPIRSQMDGVVQFIGTEIKEGENVPPEEMISLKMDGEIQRFRRLKQGDSIKAGQLMARLDDRLARADYAIKVSKVQSSVSDSEVFKAIADESEVRVKAAEQLYSMRRISLEELRSAQATRDKMYSDYLSRKNGLDQAKADMFMATEILRQHEIRSEARGVIRTINKYPGEAAKDRETVFEIEITKKGN